jgi:hypothetical protein
MATVRHLGLFPFCVGTYPPIFSDFDGGTIQLQTGAGAPYPLNLSKQLATRLWWTVKQWKITGSYYYYRTLTPVGYEQITGEIDVTTADSDFTSTDFVSRILADQKNEKQLVCEKGVFGGQRNFQWTIQLDRVADTGNGPVESATTSPLYLDFGGARFQTGTAPQFVKNGSTDSELWLNMAVSFGAWSSESEFQDRQAVCQFNLLDAAQQILLFANASTDDETLELKLEPLEFWPYDPDDSLGPIYDSQTGAQLRAFPA